MGYLIRPHVIKQMESSMSGNKCQMIYYEFRSTDEPDKTFPDEKSFMDYYFKDYDVNITTELLEVDLDCGKDDIQMIKSDGKTVSCFSTWNSLNNFNTWLTQKKAKLEELSGSVPTTCAEFMFGMPFEITKIVYDVDEIYSIYDTTFKATYPAYDDILKAIKDNPEPISTDSFLVVL